MTRRFEAIVTITVLLWTAPVHARDWFVRAGAAGDGTIATPFKDPALALEEAGPGDTIHVTQGAYHGKLDAANWVISTPNLTWLGGYNADFSQRDPWRFPSELRFSKDFRGENSGTLIDGQGSHENFVMDGFVVDQKDANVNANDPGSSHAISRSDPIIRLSAAGIQIRNCLILNGAGGIDLAGDGGRIENNIILNIARHPLVNFSSHQRGTTLIRGNTFLFSWSDSGVGSGGTPAGDGVSFWSCDNEFEITDNIFLGCDNTAVHAHTADKLALKGNVFWLNGWLNVRVQVQSQELRVQNANMSDLEDAGLKACQGNVAADPELTGLDPKWMGSFLARIAEDYPKATLEELNAMRRSLGLPAITEKKAQSPLPHGTMAYDWAAPLKIVPAKLKQGAHPVPLAVKPFSAAAATAAYDYQKASWQQLAENPRALDGKRVEIVGALGREYSAFPFAGITHDEYRGFEFQDVQEGPGQPPVIYFKKGTKAERMLSDIRQWDGRGTPPEKHLVRGLARFAAAANTRAKGTIVVDSITAITENAPVESKPRPKGRDWFVRAGASGSGTKDSPFKDPWQALEAAKRGDAIHVSEGEYFGQFKSGSWTVKTPYISLLGGYDSGFTERDPWNHPTRLGYTPGGSGSSPNAYVVGEDDHTGFVFDGFVLDGRDVNGLDSGGNLASRFPKHQLLRLGSSDVIVRNCILVNAGGPALEAWGDNLHIENNIILNSNYYSLDIRGAAEQPYVIRHNTILFTWYADRGKGSRSPGTAVLARPGARFELDGNIIGYADGQAVFSGTDRKRLRIVNNVFTHNQFADFTDGDKVVVDDKAVDRMQELGFGAAEGNVVLDPRLSFDAAWWAAYSHDQSAFFARPYDWKAALKLLPQDPSCKAGARPQKLEVHFAP